jgi:hypothetical protein
LQSNIEEAVKDYREADQGKISSKQANIDYE